MSPIHAWRTLLIGCAGSVLLWLAQPPVAWWPLAWLTPAVWARLVMMPTLAGARPYRALWVSGMLYWLLAVYWVCLPHPLTSIGWLALSAYLGLYLPLFVALARVAVQRFGWPVNAACAVVWTGLELMQAHLFSGFHMAALGHTQHRWLELIQISDLGGGYLVSFVVMFVGASLASMGVTAAAWKPLLSAAALLAAVVGYGYCRLGQSTTEPSLTAALIQGSIDMRVVSDADEFRKVREQIDRQYLELTEKALAERPDADVLIWPETMFLEPLVTYDADVREIDGVKTSREQLDYVTLQQQAKVGALARRFGKPMLLGIDAWHYLADRVERFNSVVLTEPDGRIGRRYDKMHPVMFGEYIPLAQRIPLLYQITPLTGGIESGRDAQAMRIRNAQGREIVLCSSICYESVLAHVIRRQVASLAARDEEPDVLVNHTNDGWFRGSSELEMHLVCSVFRAVECRKPVLIAANTGISAWIDGDGRIRRRCGKLEPSWLVADVGVDGRKSVYVWLGDWPAGLCLLACFVLALAGMAARRRAAA